MKKNDTVEDDPGTVSRVVSHLAELLCLQGRLLLADMKEGAQSAKLAGAFVIASAFLLIGAAPTSLIALAFLLRDRFDYSIGFALLLSAIAAVALGLLLAFAAWRAGKRGAIIAVKSYDDFEKNVRSLTRSN